MNSSSIDWAVWLAWKLRPEQLAKRREPFLQTENYAAEFDSLAGGMMSVTTDLPQYSGSSNPSDLSISTQQRLWDVFDWLALQYSAGADVAQIAAVWPQALDWAEEYGEFHGLYHKSPQAEGRIVPHAALRTEDFAIVALRLACFGILTGHANEMPRVMKFLDYGNEAMNVYDGLLERLVAPFVPGRADPPDECTRHLPYRKLFKVFAATEDKRPALIVKYLDDWYEASRREPYFDRHEARAFYGYWSWEAAAVTWLLNIDDTSYRNKDFYPRDLVDYARAHGAAPQATDPSTAGDPIRLRCEAGQPCPRSGFWFTPAQAGSRRFFAAGEVMPSVGGDYGVTIWQWDQHQ